MIVSPTDLKFWCILHIFAVIDHIPWLFIMIPLLSVFPLLGIKILLSFLLWWMRQLCADNCVCVHMHFSDSKDMMNYDFLCLRNDTQLTMPLAEIQVLRHSLNQNYFFQIHSHFLFGLVWTVIFQSLAQVPIGIDCFLFGISDLSAKSGIRSFSMCFAFLLG